MKCKDCGNYYYGCDTEVYNLGYDEDNAEKCNFFIKKDEAKDNK